MPPSLVLVQLKNRLTPDLVEELLEQVVLQFWNGKVVVAATPTTDDWIAGWRVAVPDSSRLGVEATNRRIVPGEDYGFEATYKGRVIAFSEPQNPWSSWAMRKVRQEVVKTLDAIMTQVSPEEYVIDLKDTFKAFVVDTVGKENDWTEHMLWTAPEAFKD
jgi:hypothetical protein